MDKIDVLLKKYFESRRSGLTGRREDGEYPSVEILMAYLNDELDGAGLERMLDYLKNDPEAQTLVIRARELMESQEGDWEKEAVPADLTENAKAFMPQAASASGACPHCGKAITPFQKGVPPRGWAEGAWLVMAIASFALSFAIPRYFYQCLAASLFFGFKWIVERRAAKTRILIYKALSDEPAAERQRLHQHSSRL